MRLSVRYCVNLNASPVRTSAAELDGTSADNCTARQRAIQRRGEVAVMLGASDSSATRRYCVARRVTDVASRLCNFYTI
jgi:hypothetical protein